MLHLARTNVPRSTLVAARRYAARPPAQEVPLEPPQPPRPNSQAPPQHVYGPSSEAPFEPHNQPVGGPGAQLPGSPDTRSRPLLMVGLLAAAFGVAYFVPWERGVKKQAKEMAPVVKENRAPTKEDEKRV